MSDNTNCYEEMVEELENMRIEIRELKEKVTKLEEIIDQDHAIVVGHTNDVHMHTVRYGGVTAGPISYGSHF